jgi:glucosamine--fructose-6-phosphate aminotransferase (isomerizing)
MCGIVGYVGKNEAGPFLLTGLRRLEYRGYDSAGIATLSGEAAVQGFQLRRSVGRIDRLADLMTSSPISGSAGIGHTRWATHGPATTENAHPHLGGRGQVAVVHNGVIENYEILKQTLTAKGYVFHSATDTEVIAHLVADALKRTSAAENTAEGKNAA